MDFNLKSLAAKELKPKERPTEDISDVRHRAMMEAIAPYAKKVVVNQKNLTPVYVDYKTRETSMVLVLCPEWSPHMPPFSLARLSGVAKASGYETHIMDLNVKAYNAFRDDWWPNKKIPFRLWDPTGSWHWLGTALVIGIVGIHLSRASRPRDELILILAALLIGAAWDSLLVWSGLLSYANGVFHSDLAPHWIVAMWALFATTLNISLRWLKGRCMLTVAFGAVGGPLAYYAGYRLGAVEMVNTVEALLALAVGWAVLMPILMMLSQRFNGFAHLESR